MAKRRVVLPYRGGHPKDRAERILDLTRPQKVLKFQKVDQETVDRQTVEILARGLIRAVKRGNLRGLALCYIDGTTLCRRVKWMVDSNTGDIERLLVGLEANKKDLLRIWEES